MQAENKNTFKKLGSFFPNCIVQYRATVPKDVLFYALANCIGEHGHNTEPDTLERIAEDKDFEFHEEKEVLAATLLLTYFK